MRIRIPQARTIGLAALLLATLRFQFKKPHQAYTRQTQNPPQRKHIEVLRLIDTRAESPDEDAVDSSDCGSGEGVCECADKEGWGGWVEEGGEEAEVVEEAVEEEVGWGDWEGAYATGDA